MTGADISKAIFPFHYMQWKMPYTLLAAIALILTGIHLGFHVKYLGMFFQKLIPIRLPKLAKTILIVVLSVAIIAVGAVNFANSGMSRWLSPGGGPGGPPGGGPGGPSAEMTAAEAPQENAAEASSKSAGQPDSGTEAASGAPSAELADAGSPADQTGSAEAADGAPAQAGPGGPGGPGGPPIGEMSIDWSFVFSVIWQYATMVLAVMTIVGWVDTLCLYVKDRKRVQKTNDSK